ncbi:MAG TPA: DUF2095 domain-containing protein [Hadesarchaea archaeon]|nr:DUF2095 domain-containing protein [Hadesarchaea archaeon]
MTRYKRKEFQRKYPNLADEWNEKGTITIRAVRSDLREAEKAAYNIEGYEPTVVDFLRRCENDAQALEIIDFMESKGEIESGYAKRLRSQLIKHGLKSFGKRKKPGWYEHGETC